MTLKCSGSDISFGRFVSYTESSDSSVQQNVYFNTVVLATERAKCCISSLLTSLFQSIFLCGKRTVIL